MTLHQVTVIYDFLCAKCCVIHILLDRIKSNQIIVKITCLVAFMPAKRQHFLEIINSRMYASTKWDHVGCWL